MKGRPFLNLDDERLQVWLHEPRSMKEVKNRIAFLEEIKFASRLWLKDPALWKDDPSEQEAIRNALGWLDVAGTMKARIGEISSFVEEVKASGFSHVVHMGMGGSSLAPLVFAHTFGPLGDAPHLIVLDTTDPAFILKIGREVPLRDTIFIVASKSGTTAEPNAFMDYFFEQVKAVKGARAGENFVAITDPGSSLVGVAGERRFRRTFLNFADIGGRYSALSYFGLLPVALMGLDVSGLLERALRMADACGPKVRARQNPGLVLGAVLGELARDGRDKVTFLMDDSIATFALWLEQLLAESTGKEGTGLLPVAGEPVGSPDVYGGDRVFVYVREAARVNEALERGVTELQSAGQPVIRIQLDDPVDLGAQFFLWEVATATAGAVLRINPFDQPNVQESKDNTNRLLQQVRQSGRLAEPAPILKEGPFSFYAPIYAATAADLFRAFLNQVRPGDYVALQAYLGEATATDESLRALRLILRDALHVATTSGYGPRFLHSTGQYHKGGPDTGLFLQLTADDAEDAPLPGEPYTFGIFKRAQAQGDLEALKKHGRRVMRIHLGSFVGTGLAMLVETMKEALRGGR